MLATHGAAAPAKRGRVERRRARARSPHLEAFSNCAPARARAVAKAAAARAPALSPFDCDIARTPTLVRAGVRSRRALRASTVPGAVVAPRIIVSLSAHGHVIKPARRGSETAENRSGHRGARQRPARDRRFPAMVYAMDRRATSARGAGTSTFGSAGRDAGGAPTSYAGVRATTTRSVQPREFEFSFGDAGGATRAPTHRARAASAAPPRPASSFKVRRIPRATATDPSPGPARPAPDETRSGATTVNRRAENGLLTGPSPASPSPSPPRPGAPRVPRGGQTALPDAPGDASRDGVRPPRGRHPDRLVRDPRSTTRADPTHQRGPPQRRPPLELERVPVSTPVPVPVPVLRPRPRTLPSSEGVDGPRASRASSRVHLHAHHVRRGGHRRGVPTSVRRARGGTGNQNRAVERKNVSDDARANLPAGDRVVAITPRSSQPRARARRQTRDLGDVRLGDGDFRLDLDLASGGSRETFGRREAVHGGRDDVVPRRSRSRATDDRRRYREGGARSSVSADEPGGDEGRFFRGSSDALLGAGHDRARQGGARVVRVRVRVRDAPNRRLDGDGDGRGGEPSRGGSRDGSRDGATRRRIRGSTRRETRRRIRPGRFVRGDASTRAHRTYRRATVAASSTSSEGCDVRADADARSRATRSGGRVR